MVSLLLQVVYLWYVLILLEVLAELISRIYQAGCLSVLLLNAEASQLFKRGN